MSAIFSNNPKIQKHKVYLYYEAYFHGFNYYQPALFVMYGNSVMTIAFRVRAPVLVEVVIVS
jgi:hypothetical protein